MMKTVVAVDYTPPERTIAGPGMEKLGDSCFAELVPAKETPGIFMADFPASPRSYDQLRIAQDRKVDSVLINFDAIVDYARNGKASEIHLIRVEDGSTGGFISAARSGPLAFAKQAWQAFRIVLIDGYQEDLNYWRPNLRRDLSCPKYVTLFDALKHLQLNPRFTTSNVFKGSEGICQPRHFITIDVPAGHLDLAGAYREQLEISKREADL